MIPTIIAAITAAGTDFTTIEHAWSLEPVDHLESAAPALYLYEGAGKGLDSDADSCVQNVEVRSVVCLMVCKWASLETLRNQAKAVVRGYQFASTQTPLKLAASETVSINGEYIWRKDTYVTTDYQ